MKPKSDLIRITKIKQSSENHHNFAGDKVFIDYKQKSGGRGNYICRDLLCLKKVKKSRRLEKVFSFDIASWLYGEIEDKILKGNQD
jgi:predicted RNA-binding protein YlxR (DUF448 family)